MKRCDQGKVPKDLTNLGMSGTSPVKIKQKVSKAHIPPAVAIRDNTNLIGKKEKWINKGADKQHVADFLCTVQLFISDVYTKFQDPRSGSS